jgi:hypothetical protein
MGTIKRWAAARQPRGVKPPQFDIVGLTRVLPPAPCGVSTTKDESTIKLKDLETSVPKNVTEGGRVALTCDVVISVFYAFFASSRCLSSVVMVLRAFVGSLGPPRPAEKNSGILSCYILILSS